jgi:hypothetical protein
LSTISFRAVLEVLSVVALDPQLQDVGVAELAEARPA